MNNDHGIGLASAKQVLADNYMQTNTAPSKMLYPHQWLWDSSFIAIGLRHYDLDLAMSEIDNLLDGQWQNGMLPNIIFRKSNSLINDANIWKSWINPQSPVGQKTSGITQPPMVAEAVAKIGEKLPEDKRKSWYQKTLPKLISYHQWLYKDRDPHSEGLTLQIHPWETGLDNSPPWMNELHDHRLTWWVSVVKALNLKPVINYLRRDTNTIPADERIDTIDALALYDIQKRLKRKKYDIRKILSHSLLTIEDVGFNSILIRANTHLKNIAAEIDVDLPNELLGSMAKSITQLENLWDQDSKYYYSRNFATHELLKIPTVASLLPLYSGEISIVKAKYLVKHLENELEFGSLWPIPSTPVNSEWFSPTKYWQGPSWLNTNWMIIDGLRRYGFDSLAKSLIKSSIDMVDSEGFYEYFNPLDGKGKGAPNFSWTAALYIDLVNQTRSSSEVIPKTL